MNGRKGFHLLFICSSPIPLEDATNCITIFNYIFRGEALERMEEVFTRVCGNFYTVWKEGKRGEGRENSNG